MINKVNGEIEIGNVRVSPSTTLSNFSKSTLGISSKVLIKNNDYVTLQVVTASQIGLNLSFSNDRLSTVIIYLKSPESTWSSWSKNEEHEKKTKHDKILNADLGLEPYRFSWGEVESISDSKSGDSYVLVKYRTK
ncbi:hypothetical protein [uncultured Gimesia sp.]|uniref:hypothetical protein n=1 Tax=uncultured Gimesia sp. TaxID=1678688 RepID=UPI0030D88745|tara:strand:- start:5468 stop:5872 length:405 start_codon:yes stop_codon:yes gene_type:complete